MSKSLKAILFDMDGTLGDTLPFILRALQETFIRYNAGQYSFAEITALFGPTEEGLIRRQVPKDVAEQAIQFYLDRYAVLQSVEPEPFLGVIELLQFLHGRGIKTGVVTGKGPRSAAITLKAYGLEPIIAGMVSGSPNGGEKPQAIRKLLAEWGISPQDAAYVGDMSSDMEAAREAGVTALGAAWAKMAEVSEKDGLIFRSVADLKTWLEENS